MNIETVSKAQIAQEYITAAVDVKMAFSIAVSPGCFAAMCYYPNGDSLRDKFCYGSADTLAGAIAIMLEKVEAAKDYVRPLTTAAECKEAVLNLIREHDAAPASFRDAVDALPVKG